MFRFTRIKTSNLDFIFKVFLFTKLIKIVILFYENTIQFLCYSKIVILLFYKTKNFTNCEVFDICETKLLFFNIAFRYRKFFSKTFNKMNISNFRATNFIR